jgi:hypothetical protein
MGSGSKKDVVGCSKSWSSRSNDLSVVENGTLRYLVPRHNRLEIRGQSAHDNPGACAHIMCSRTNSPVDQVLASSRRNIFRTNSLLLYHISSLLIQVAPDNEATAVPSPPYDDYDSFLLAG